MDGGRRGPRVKQTARSSDEGRRQGERAVVEVTPVMLLNPTINAYVQRDPPSAVSGTDVFMVRFTRTDSGLVIVESHTPQLGGRMALTGRNTTLSESLFGRERMPYRTFATLVHEASEALVAPSETPGLYTDPATRKPLCTDGQGLYCSAFYSRADCVIGPNFPSARCFYCKVFPGTSAAKRAVPTERYLDFRHSPYGMVAKARRQPIEGDADGPCLFVQWIGDGNDNYAGITFSKGVIYLGGYPYVKDVLAALRRWLSGGAANLRPLIVKCVNVTPRSKMPTELQPPPIPRESYDKVFRPVRQRAGAIFSEHVAKELLAANDVANYKLVPAMVF